MDYQTKAHLWFTAYRPLVEAKIGFQCQRLARLGRFERDEIEADLWAHVWRDILEAARKNKLNRITPRTCAQLAARKVYVRRYVHRTDTRTDALSPRCPHRAFSIDDARRDIDENNLAESLAERGDDNPAANARRRIDWPEIIRRAAPAASRWHKSTDKLVRVCALLADGFSQREIRRALQTNGNSLQRWLRSVARAAHGYE